MKLILRTPYGDKYIIHENGDIQRTDMEHEPSGGWKFVGLTHVKKNLFIPFSKIRHVLSEGFNLLYKNGNPQWTVRDLDHGTTREWGNTKYHGVKSIEIK